MRVGVTVGVPHPPLAGTFPVGQGVGVMVGVGVSVRVGVGVGVPHPPLAGTLPVGQGVGVTVGVGVSVGVGGFVGVGLASPRRIDKLVTQTSAGSTGSIGMQGCGSS